MIYRKWSLLTGPVAIIGGIVGAVVVADILFIEKDLFRKTEQKKLDAPPATK